MTTLATPVFWGPVPLPTSTPATRGRPSDSLTALPSTTLRRCRWISPGFLVLSLTLRSPLSSSLRAPLPCSTSCFLRSTTRSLGTGGLIPGRIGIGPRQLRTSRGLLHPGERDHDPWRVYLFPNSRRPGVGANADCPSRAGRPGSGAPPVGASAVCRQNSWICICGAARHRRTLERAMSCAWQ